MEIAITNIDVVKESKDIIFPDFLDQQRSPRDLEIMFKEEELLKVTSVLEDLKEDPLILFGSTIYSEDYQDHYFVKALDELAIHLFLLSRGVNKRLVSHLRNCIGEHYFSEDFHQILNKVRAHRSKRPTSFREKLRLITAQGYFGNFDFELSNGKIPPSMAKKIIRNADRYINRAISFIEELELTDNMLELFDIQAPYLSAYTNYREITFYCDTLNLKLNLNKKNFNRDIFKGVQELFVNRELIQVRSELERNRIRYIDFISGEGNRIRNSFDFLDSHIKYSIFYNTKEREFTREHGEVILDLDIILFEISQFIPFLSEEELELLDTPSYVPNSEVNNFIKSKRKIWNCLEKSEEISKEMFFSTLNEDQKRMYEKHGFTLLEGKQYFYLYTGETYNSLIRFRKDLEAIDLGLEKEFPSLCIYTDPSIPKYDLAASIVLHLKSDQEEVIDKNSNKFLINKNNFSKLKKFFSLYTERGLNFSGLNNLNLVLD